jgi:hypothetical protein
MLSERLVSVTIQTQEFGQSGNQPVQYQQIVVTGDRKDLALR